MEPSREGVLAAFTEQQLSIRSIGNLLESVIGTIGIGALVSVIKTTKSLLDADLAHGANTIAMVYADSTDANNDLYVKSGGSGSGAWTNTGALHDIVEGLVGPLQPDGDLNVQFGGAGNLTKTGGNNVLIGVSAGEDLTTGTNNTSIGRAAARDATTGNENTSVGSSAGLSITTGNGNTRVGFGAQGNTAGSSDNITAVGWNALSSCIVDEATALGSSAGQNLTTGVRFTAVGAGAGTGHTAQDAITMIGWAAGQNVGQTLIHDNQTAVGADAYCDWENQVALGDDSVAEFRLFGDAWARQYANFDTIIGQGAGNRSTLGGGKVVIGYNAGQAMDTADDESVVVIGYVAGNSAEKLRYSVFIGDRAGQYAYNTIDCTATGSQAARNLGRLEPAEYDSDDEDHILAAGADVTHGGSLPVPGLVGATFFGKNAGRYNTIGLNNTGFGDSALGYTTVGQANVAVGYVCGEGNVTGSRNSMVGQGIRLRIYSGDDNVAVGYGIGSNLGSHGDWRAGGDRNANVGAAAAYIWGGSDTASLGFRTLYNMSAGTGGDVAIGARAAEALITGGQNVFIGQDSGQGVGQATDVQNSIAIGAGTVTDKDNQAVLGNSSVVETIVRGVTRHTTFAVSALPSAATVGAGSRAFVTDANAATFNSVVASGGANKVPVFSDGTAWRIG